jgi:hypothetical protein
MTGFEKVKRGRVTLGGGFRVALGGRGFVTLGGRGFIVTMGIKGNTSQIYEEGVSSKLWKDASSGTWEGFLVLPALCCTNQCLIVLRATAKL